MISLGIFSHQESPFVYEPVYLRNQWSHLEFRPFCSYFMLLDPILTKLTCTQSRCSHPRPKLFSLSYRHDFSLQLCQSLQYPFPSVHVHNASVYVAAWFFAHAYRRKAYGLRSDWASSHQLSFWSSAIRLVREIWMTYHHEILDIGIHAKNSTRYL